MAEDSNLVPFLDCHQRELDLEEQESHQPRQQSEQEESEDESLIESLDSNIPNWPIDINSNNSNLSSLDCYNPQICHQPHVYSDSDSDCSDSLADMNFVTNLFEHRRDYAPNDDLDQNMVLESFLGGFEEGNGFGVYGSGQVEEEHEIGFGVEENSSSSGLRVVGIDSESDVEEETDGIDDAEDIDLDLPVLWNCISFDDERHRNDGYEWEEVDDHRQGFSSVIDRIEEVTISSEIFSEDDDGDDDSVNIEDVAVRNLEWELLVAVNNFNRDFELENDGGITYLAVQDDSIYAAEYNALFGQFVETENALKGSPPAAKSVVESLPLVVLTKEYVQKNTVVCAVCMDEFLVEDRATSLPCSHHYHGDCIMPWLNLRNTCPVCRFELPTDDTDYERRKETRGGLGLLDDLQVRYDLEVLP